MNGKWPTWTCEYEYDGSRWGVDICAPTFEDAQERLRAIGWTGKVDGELMGVIECAPSASPVVGLWVRFVCWWKNLVKR